ncbi:bifunctional diguanylate cyclase/phosphodiesterase [Ruminococcus flavefaciens]|uniref:bifunctional diguanylate cyclase/phosphodiesterase n=1 Tax=Ruminococcus flavefaciens TaxID=1265 RepID=UPI000463A7B8|nr:diguanylate cyclase [Ruminococcus flavefaciens]
MDFDRIVADHKCRSCIISVEKYQDGSYGNIRVVAANKAHRDDSEKVFGRPFVPDSPYSDSLPQDKNFEDFMYRCACLGQPLHTYVHVERMGLWVNMFLLPLESDKENVGYCLYSCDISPYADAEQQASLSADTATSALEICIKLQNAKKDDVHQVFQDIIEEIRKICGADHCCIFNHDMEKSKYIKFCEATEHESNIRSDEIYSNDSFYDIAESFEAAIHGSSCLIIKDERDLEWLESENKDFYLLLTDNGVKSAVLFPLKHNDQILGYLWALNYKTEDTVRIKETLELSTFFIASEIANYQLMKQLEILSSIDLLTGCKNRNSMNNYVNDVITGKVELIVPYAVIFADLNGLKRVNDEKGHSSGDRLLRTASAILSQIFYDCDVYRAGGDEFMLIAQGIDEAELKTRLVQLDEKSAIDSDVNFAVGYYFVSNGEDIRMAMKNADEKMYINKKEFYNMHPELKYR